MENGLIDKISKENISNCLKIESYIFRNMPETAHFSFYFKNELTGYGGMFINHKNQKIESIMFYPLDHCSKLRGNKIGQAAYFLFLKEAILNNGVGLDYNFERRVKDISASQRKMLKRINIFDSFKGYSEELLLKTPIGLILNNTQQYLVNNGYDVEALIRNGINQS